MEQVEEHLGCDQGTNQARLMKKVSFCHEHRLAGVGRSRVWWRCRAGAPWLRKSVAFAQRDHLRWYFGSLVRRGGHGLGFIREAVRQRRGHRPLVEALCNVCSAEAVAQLAPHDISSL